MSFIEMSEMICNAITSKQAKMNCENSQIFRHSTKRQGVYKRKKVDLNATTTSVSISTKSPCQSLIISYITYLSVRTTGLCFYSMAYLG